MNSIRIYHNKFVDRYIMTPGVDIENAVERATKPFDDDPLRKPDADRVREQAKHANDDLDKTGQVVQEVNDAIHDINRYLDKPRR
jgi:type IV secretory pathway VirD2 relaxase